MYNVAPTLYKYNIGSAGIEVQNSSSLLQHASCSLFYKECNTFTLNTSFMTSRGRFQLHPKIPYKFHNSPIESFATPSAPFSDIIYPKLVGG